ncbi:MAG: metallophosphoesterase [Clostridiales bacterium]|nr:metallophosphoesterase [Clostridiales bacterium]
MKIIHCSDIHLESPLRLNFSAQKAKERRAEIFESFCGLVGYAEAKNVKAVIIAGDLFDTDDVSERVKRGVEDVIRLHGGISFFLLRGNHDKTAGLFDKTGVPGNLKLFDAGRWTAYDLDGVTVSGINPPYEYSDGLCGGPRLDPGGLNIAVMHGAAVNYKSGDMTDAVLLPQLRDKNIDYLALGHYHNFFRADLDKRGIYCYSGCLEGRGFDESGKKGFVLIDADAQNKKLTAQFVAFCKRTVYDLTVDITGVRSMYALETAVLGALADLEPSDIAGLTLRGGREPLLHIDLERLSEIANGRVYYCKIADESRLAIDPSDYAGDLSLKGEFIRLVSNDAGLSPDEKSAVIERGLKAMDGGGRGI